MMADEPNEDIKAMSFEQALEALEKIRLSRDGKPVGTEPLDAE